MILDAGNNSMELESETIGGRVAIEYYPLF